jgi:hypothetical protein
MPDQDRTKRLAAENRRKAGAISGFIPEITIGYDDNALTQGATALAKSFNKAGANAPKDTMGGSTGRTEGDFQAQRAGEREGMGQFGDDKEKLGAAMARSLMGSKKFTKGEVRKGFRKL